MKSEKQKKHLEKLRLLHLGSKHSEKTKDKIRKKAIGRKYSKKSNLKKGNWCRGKTYEEIYGERAKTEKQKHSLALKGKPKSLESRLKITGKNHYNWKGGRTSLLVKIRNTIEYHSWRLNVFKRDGFRCINCQKVGGKLRAHHIKAISKILDENNIKTVEEALKCKELWDTNNGVTLCNECHKLTDNYGRKKLCV